MKDQLVRYLKRYEEIGDEIYKLEYPAMKLKKEREDLVKTIAAWMSIDPDNHTDDFVLQNAHRKIGEITVREFKEPSDAKD